MNIERQIYTNLYETSIYKEEIFNHNIPIMKIQTKRVMK